MTPLSAVQILPEALHDFLGYTPTPTPNATLELLGIEEAFDAEELGISVENVLIDKYQIKNPPDMDQVFRFQMTVEEAQYVLQQALTSIVA